MPTVSSGYFDTAFDKREKIIGTAVKALKYMKDEYDVIVCRGYSGMIIAPTLAFCLKKKLFAVRKVGENCHSTKQVVGDLGERYLIVDDFIATGKTIETIIETVYLAHEEFEYDCSGKKPIFVGIYLYETNDTKVKYWSRYLAANGYDDNCISFWNEPVY